MKKFFRKFLVFGLKFAILAAYLPREGISSFRIPPRCTLTTEYTFFRYIPCRREPSVDENGELITEENEVEYNYLLIQVSHKTAAEMAEHYGFTDKQKEQLNELLLPENQSTKINAHVNRYIGSHGFLYALPQGFLLAFGEA